MPLAQCTAGWSFQLGTKAQVPDQDCSITV
jgi:hypothetical protein